MEQLIVPELSADIQSVIKRQAIATRHEQTARTVTISDDDERDIVVGSLADVKVMAKETEGERTKVVKPFNDFLDRVNAMFKTISTPLKNAEQMYKEKLGTYEAHKELERKKLEEAERKKYEEQVAAEQTKPQEAQEFIAPPLAALPERRIATAEATVSTAQAWDFEVTDIAKFYKARPDLCTVEVKRREVKSLAQVLGKAGQTVEGLRIFAVTNVNVRTH